MAVLSDPVLTADAPSVGQNRYYLRTALLTFTPILEVLAAACAVAAEGRLALALPM